MNDLSIEAFLQRLAAAQGRVLDQEVEQIKLDLNTPGPQHAGKGESPHKQSGKLHDSIGQNTEVEDGVISSDLYSTAEYAVYLEHKGHPVLSQSLDRMRQELLKRIKEEIRQ